jgi:hypothetical protein
MSGNLFFSLFSTKFVFFIHQNNLEKYFSRVNSTFVFLWGGGGQTSQNSLNRKFEKKEKKPGPKSWNYYAENDLKSKIS